MMYKLQPNSDGVSRLSDGVSIPADHKNRDYAEYLKWVAQGNTPDPADPPVLPTYSESRAKEYPPVGDILDELLKVTTIPVGSGLELLEAQRQAAKTKYPKV